MSNEELDYYLANKESHKVNWFKSTITNLTNKTNSTSQASYIDYNPDLIDSYLQELEDFYETVKDRDVAMVRNAVSEIEKRNAKVATLIAGGFHTKGITRMLREQGYSYIVVSPYSSTDIDEENYHFLLSGQRKPITELMKELDLPEIVDRLSTSLRVGIAFDQDIIEEMNKKVVPEVAKIWGISEEELTTENILDRIGPMLAVARGAEKWEEPIEVKSPRTGTIILKFLSRDNKPSYIEITKDSVRLVNEGEFLGRTLVATSPEKKPAKLASNAGITREFGKTGLRFFPLGMGTIWLGREWPIGDSSYTVPGLDEIGNHLDKAFARMGNEEGWVMIDTAAAYGSSEEEIGKYLRKKPDLSQKAFIATKWGEDYNTQTKESSHDYSKKNLISSVDRSLSNLGKIDLLYIHGTGGLDQVLGVLKDREVIGEMQGMRKTRNVQYLGISISNTDILNTALGEDLLDPFDVVQIPIWLFEQQSDLVDRIYKKGIAIVINSPVRKGGEAAPAENYASLLSNDRVAMVLTGTRHHLDETIGYAESREEKAAEDNRLAKLAANANLFDQWAEAEVSLDDLNLDMFRDYDYRNTGTKFLSPQMIFRFGLVWADMALEKANNEDIANRTVLLARDARKIEPELVEALTSALRYRGLDVIYISADAPNAATSYSWAAQEHRPLMSIFITASHVSEPVLNKEGLPVYIRGFKVAMLNKKGGALQSMTTKEIKQESKKDIIDLIENPEQIRGKGVPEKGKFIPSNVDKNCVRMCSLVGRVAFSGESLYELARELELSKSPVDVLTEWEEEIGFSEPLKGMKVVVEGVHTASGKLAADTFRSLGAKAILINGDIQEVEGEHEADPAKEENLSLLKETIEKENADFGIAFDLDGDRGAIVVPWKPITKQGIKGEEFRFETLAPDNLIVLLMPYLIEKCGYDSNVINKELRVIRDVLGTFGVNDMAKKIRKEKGQPIEVSQTDAGYVFLKKERQRFLEEGHAVPIYGERSGHCWLDVTGEFENPIAVAALFAVMVKERKYVSDRTDSRNPFFETYLENPVPYKQSRRFQPLFHPDLLVKLSSDSRNNTGWTYDAENPTKPPQAIIALGKDAGIKRLREELTIGKIYKTPAGELKVREFNTYRDPADLGGLYRFADIMFELDGRFAGRFVFRASSNDPTFVCSFETPVMQGENLALDTVNDRYISAGGLVLDWLEKNGLARVTGDDIDYANKESTEDAVMEYRNKLKDLGKSDALASNANVSTLIPALKSLSERVDFTTDNLALKILDSIIPSQLITDVAEAGGRPTNVVIDELKGNELTSAYAENKGSLKPVETGLRKTGLADKLDKAIEDIAEKQGVSKERMVDVFLTTVDSTTFVKYLTGSRPIPASEKILNMRGIALVLQEVPLFALIGTTYRVERLEDEKTNATITLKPEDIVSKEALEDYAAELDIEVTFPEDGFEVDEGQWNVIKDHFDQVAEACARREYKYRGDVMAYYERFLKTDAMAYGSFIKKVFGDKSKIKYLITSGIGANEMFSHLMAALNNKFYSKGIQWIVVDSPEDIKNLPKDADKSNTLVVEMSRSGGTQETLKFAEFTYERFPNRIVYANEGKLKEFTEKISKGGANTLILDLPQDIGGRLMRRKSPMLLGLLHLSDLDAEAYFKYTDEFDKKLDFKQKDKSLAVQLARFIYINIVLGNRHHLSAMYNQKEFLRGAMYELRQLWMEGANKKPRYGLVMNINEFPRDPHVAMEGVYGQSHSAIAIAMIARKSGFKEDERVLTGVDVVDSEHKDVSINDVAYNTAAPNVEKAQKIMPTISIEMEIVTPEVAAALSTLSEDLGVYFCALTGQDPNSNPQVKSVRQETGKMLTSTAIAKRLAVKENAKRVKQLIDKKGVDAFKRTIAPVLSFAAEEARDSRNRPTVKVTLKVGKVEVEGDVPAGASTGKAEAATVDFAQAIRNINEIISPMLNESGLDLRRHADLIEMEKKLIEAAGKNFEELGANATVPVSRALWNMAAKLNGMELYEYIRENEPDAVSDKKEPVYFYMNIYNGGLHAVKEGEALGKDRIDIQEIMIVPVNAGTYRAALNMGDDIDFELKKILKDKFKEGTITRADEAGFSVKGLGDSTGAIGYVFEAIERAGFVPGVDVKLALDVAASSFYKDGKYLFQGKELTSDEMIAYYVDLVEKYGDKIISIEDGLDENDWDGWRKLNEEMEKRGIDTIGDDLFVTQLPRLNKGIRNKSASAILIKVNQNGTMYGTLEVIKRARRNGKKWVVSHRSGETMDNTIADLAYATNGLGLKTGDPQPPYDFGKGGEYEGRPMVRRVKYERMVAIERAERAKGSPEAFKLASNQTLAPEPVIADGDLLSDAEKERLVYISNVPSLVITETSGGAELRVAQRIADLIKSKNENGEKTFICFATGGTYEGVYEKLVEITEAEDISWENVVTFNLDEYIFEGESRKHYAEQSYRSYMLNNLFDWLIDNAGLKMENIHLMDGLAEEPEAEARRYKDLFHRLTNDEGVDLILFGIGVEGHIAFIEAQHDMSLNEFVAIETGVVDLADSTIKANARFFDSEEEVPHRAYSLGIFEILYFSKEVILTATGSSKADAIKKAVAGEVTALVPASVLQMYPNATIVADKDAAGGVIELAKMTKLASNAGLTKTSRKQQVDTMDQIIAVPAANVIADKEGFERWLANQPENIAVLIVAMPYEYDSVQEYKDIVYIKVVGKEISGDHHLKLIEMFAMFEDPNMFGGIRLGKAYKDNNYRSLAEDLASGI
ncbi:MAG: aldo/keto reductase [Candidatus Omnitrophica bacterium]|nr:aldo/keto reductase [Candidatus Omnitrophota bacterium]